ncbi:hypothetical protein F4778DRAFT_781027 [Xylariomycetidae sp. FL2044]|nr:hypothetical protein F4778DRAFT_781027 [Xylariomycetidae sp. FL2044]
MNPIGIFTNAFFGGGGGGPQLDYPNLLHRDTSLAAGRLPSDGATTGVGAVLNTSAQEIPGIIAPTPRYDHDHGGDGNEMADAALVDFRMGNITSPVPVRPWRSEDLTVAETLVNYRTEIITNFSERAQPTLANHRREIIANFSDRVFPTGEISGPAPTPTDTGDSGSDSGAGIQSAADVLLMNMGVQNAGEGAPMPDMAPGTGPVSSFASVLPSVRVDDTFVDTQSNRSLRAAIIGTDPPLPVVQTSPTDQEVDTTSDSSSRNTDTRRLMPSVVQIPTFADTRTANETSHRMTIDTVPPSVRVIPVTRAPTAGPSQLSASSVITIDSSPTTITLETVLPGPTSGMSSSSSFGFEDESEDLLNTLNRETADTDSELAYPPQRDMMGAPPGSDVSGLYTDPASPTEREILEIRESVTPHFITEKPTTGPSPSESTPMVDQVPYTSRRMTIDTVPASPKDAPEETDDGRSSPQVTAPIHATTVDLSPRRPTSRRHVHFADGRQSNRAASGRRAGPHQNGGGRHSGPTSESDVRRTEDHPPCDSGTITPAAVYTPGVDTASGSRSGTMDAAVAEPTEGQVSFGYTWRSGSWRPVIVTGTQTP